MIKYTILLLMAILLVVAASPVYADSGDIEIVKKDTVKGHNGKVNKPATLVSTGISGEPVSGNRYAVVVGIEDYPGTGSDLQFAVDDANEVASVLTTVYEFTSVIKLTDSAATESAIFNAVNSIKSVATSKDEVVFYFSGHGAKGKVDDGDSNADQAIVTWNDSGGFGFIWDGELVKWFEDFPATRIVFIFDSCLSGGMAVLEAPNRVICMASTINSMSLEGVEWGEGHGQFTYYLVEKGLRDTMSVEASFDLANASCKAQRPTVRDGFYNDLGL